MASSLLPIPPPKSIPPSLHHSLIFSIKPPTNPFITTKTTRKPPRPLTITSSSSSSPKIVRCPPLDRRASAHNRLRFVRKLTTLLLSKPRHFLPLRILSRCRPYLSLPPRRPLLPMILRYPTLFRLLHTPSSSSSSSSLLSVSLTPAALSLFSRHSTTSSVKLQKLLMLSSHPRLLLSKLVHLAPDLGFPANFRSRICNSHPDLFRTIDTSYGRALELVSCDPNLIAVMPTPSSLTSNLKPAYDDRGKLMVEDEMVRVKEELEELVREGKRMRRARRRGLDSINEDKDEDDGEEEEEEEYFDEGDELGALFDSGIGNDWEDLGDGGGDLGDEDEKEIMEFWSLKGANKRSWSEDGEARLEVW